MFFNRVMTRTPIILLMGGPGSGKGVLAQRLSEFNHVSTGEALREITANPAHPLASRFNSRMQQGDLLGDHEVLNILSALPLLQQKTPVLLDGFPRTFNQWDLFRHHFGLPAGAIHVSVKAQTMRQRLLGRGRLDDNETVIEHRIRDYFEKTKPMSDTIRQQITHSLVIEADHLNPDEVAEQAQRFLQHKILCSTQPEAHGLC